MPIETAASVVSTTALRKGHGRRRLPADLPREQKVIDLPEDQKPCPCCGKPRQCIGQEFSEKLDYVPAEQKKGQESFFKKSGSNRTATRRMKGRGLNGSSQEGCPHPWVGFRG